MDIIDVHVISNLCFLMVDYPFELFIRIRLSNNYFEF